MRKTILMLTAASAVALASMPASAQSYRSNPNYVAPVAGAAVGTAVGVGIYNGWFGSTIAGAALPTTVAGAAVGGGLAGVGTVALIHAATTPCTGFQAVFSPFNPSAGAGCVNGEYVGYQEQPRRVRR
ncbi:MAG: hypothetical protein JWN71_4389 [Xanthobacteraceae bacterium]|nr:hypothetical protein [Xanthobacteraceae bacterium]